MEDGLGISSGRSLQHFSLVVSVMIALAFWKRLSRSLQVSATNVLKKESAPLPHRLQVLGSYFLALCEIMLRLDAIIKARRFGRTHPDSQWVPGHGQFPPATFKPRQSTLLSGRRLRSKPNVGSVDYSFGGPEPHGLGAPVEAL